jgi:hypothetical protein
VLDVELVEERPRRTTGVLEIQHVNMVWLKTHKILRIWFLKNSDGLQSNFTVLSNVEDPNPDPSINKQKIIKNLDFYLFASYF